MAPPSPQLSQLARRIVEHEAGGSHDPAGSAAAVESACGRLTDHLTDLLGSGGVAALLRRALHLAQREQPLLADVSASGEAGRCFIGLADAVAASSNEEAAAATAAVLTHILDLLVMLLGEDLAINSIRKLWPHTTSPTEIDQ